MSEENKTKAQELVTDVASRIANGAANVRERLVECMFDREQEKRVQDLDKGFQRRTELSRALNKVNRADNVLKNADGSVAQELYTDARIKEINKAKENLQKHENAMEKALGGDFQKLRELNAKK